MVNIIKISGNQTINHRLWITSQMSTENPIGKIW